MIEKVSLFTPFEFNGIILKNRLVMPPMSRYACDRNGYPNSKLADYYIRRSQNGVGLIVVEAAAIDDNLSKSYPNGLCMFSREHSDFWKPVIKKIKNSGASIIIQLYHAGRLTTPAVCGQIPVAPSAIAPFKQKSHLMDISGNNSFHSQTKDIFVPPTEIKPEEIEIIQNNFARAAGLAAEAGFDGVELHAAHGYLLHQFMSKVSNIRSDKYGTDTVLFLKETISKCKSSMNTEMILSVRLSQHFLDSSFIRYNKMVLDFEKVVDSIDSEIDIYSCSEIDAGSPMFGSDISLSEHIRNYTNKPIITSGRINSLSKANALLNSGNTDLVSIGRLLIANPNLLELFRNSQDSEIIKYENSKHSEIIY